MGDSSSDPHFRCEPSQPLAIGRESGRKEFQRNLLFELQVYGAVHLPHAAASQETDDAITSGEQAARREMKFVERENRAHCVRSVEAIDSIVPAQQRLNLASNPLIGTAIAQKARSFRFGEVQGVSEQFLGPPPGGRVHTPQFCDKRTYKAISRTLVTQTATCTFSVSPTDSSHRQWSA